MSFSATSLRPRRRVVAVLTTPRQEPERRSAGFRLPGFGIAGHHAGLADGVDLDRRLDPLQVSIEPYGNWRAHAGPLPEEAALAPTTPGGGRSRHPGFSQAFLARMLFSCLADADFLETEAFYARAHREAIDRGAFTPLKTLRDGLRLHMARLRSTETAIDALRTRVLDHAIGKATLRPGLFTLTVPTGGGKTLASLSFALEHALNHGLRRVV